MTTAYGSPGSASRSADGWDAEPLDPRLLARNTVFNITGQTLPLIVAVFTIPYLVHGLGPQRFGILSLAWAMVSYFALFDLGFGRAVTRYAAQFLALGNRAGAQQIIATGTVCQLLVGAAIAVAMIGATPMFTFHFLRIPSPFFKEAQLALLALALSVPPLVASNGLFGGLEARQCFGSANLVRLVSGIGTQLIPAAAVWLQLDLVRMFTALTAWRWLCFGLLVVVSARVGMSFRPAACSVHALRRMTQFALWVGLSSVIVPVTTYLDRFILAHLISLAAVTYYNVPYELTAKLLVIGSAVAGAVFPGFSVVRGATAQRAAEQAARLILVGLGVPCILLVGFGRELLTVWAGTEIAAKGGNAVRLLAVATLLNGIGYVPYALVQAMGRPEVVTLFHFLELPIYGALAWALIIAGGVDGAAWAWLVRTGVSVPAFSVICLRIAGLSVNRFMETVGRTALVLLSVGVGAVVLARSLAEWSGAGWWAGAVGAGGISALLLWRFTLTREDRAGLAAARCGAEFLGRG